MTDTDNTEARAAAERIAATTRTSEVRYGDAYMVATAYLAQSERDRVKPQTSHKSRTDNAGG